MSMTTLEKLASENPSDQDAGLAAALHYDPEARTRLVGRLLERLTGTHGSACAYPILIVAAGDADAGACEVRSFMRWTLEQCIERAMSLESEPEPYVLNNVELDALVDVPTVVERGTPPDPETPPLLWSTLVRFDNGRSPYRWAWFHLLKAAYYSLSPKIGGLRERLHATMMSSADSISYATNTGAYDALYPQELRRRAEELDAPL